MPATTTVPRGRGFGNSRTRVSEIVTPLNFIDDTQNNGVTIVGRRRSEVTFAEIYRQQERFPQGRLGLVPEQFTVNGRASRNGRVASARVSLQHPPGENMPNYGRVASGRISLTHNRPNSTSYRPNKRPSTSKPRERSVSFGKRSDSWALSELRRQADALSKRLKTARREREKQDNVSETEETQKEVNSETPEERRERLRRKMRIAFRVTKTICILCLEEKERATKDMEADSLAKLYMYNAGGAVEGRRLPFDKSQYSRLRGCHVSLAARTICSKEPQTRSEEEVRKIYRVLNSLRSFKERFTESMKHRISQCARYQNCDQGRMIVRQGHVGQNFYFVYSGSLFVQITTEDSDTGQTTTHIENIIEPGASFGELALLRDDGERTASVVCREHTELFQIDKDAFLEICPGVFMNELKRKIEIVSQHPMFRSWGEDTVRNLCFQSQLLTIPHGKVLEPDWSTASHIYFIVQGKLQLLREVTIADVNRDHHTVLRDNSGKKLPRPRSCVESRQRKARKRSATLHVGFLEPGEQSDLRVLDVVSRQEMAPVIMVSSGVEVLRMSVTVMHTMAVEISSMVKTYIRNDYIPKEIPCTRTLHEAFLKLTSWQEFRENVVTTLHKEALGEPIALVPVTDKGSSGWARWPGLNVKRKPASCFLHDDSLSCVCSKNLLKKGYESD